VSWYPAEAVAIRVQTATMKEMLIRVLKKLGENRE
jgi:hypothetical protein